LTLDSLSASLSSLRLSSPFWSFIFSLRVFTVVSTSLLTWESFLSFSCDSRLICPFSALSLASSFSFSLSCLRALLSSFC
jgi:hypothetical protein